MDYALLVTRGAYGALHCCPLMTLEWAPDGIARFLVPCTLRLATDLQHCPRVMLVYAAPGDQGFVSLTGQAELLRDGGCPRDLWNQRARAFSPRGLADPDVGVLCMIAGKLAYWTGADELFSALTGAADGRAACFPVGNPSGGSKDATTANCS
jgi:general stress protein 26